jgi:hypothetical protein
VEVLCQANYQRCLPAMETEGIKRIFSRSETMWQLQYTEYFGNSNSKDYSEIEHFYDNVQVGKKGMCWARTKANWNSSPETEKGKQRNWWKRKTDRHLELVARHIAMVQIFKALGILSFSPNLIFLQ